MQTNLPILYMYLRDSLITCIANVSTHFHHVHVHTLQLHLYISFAFFFSSLGTAEELFDKLQQVLTLLHSATVDATNPTGHALPLISMDFDLLLDALVVVWEVARPALARINSHSYATCRQFLNHPTGKQVRACIHTYTCKCAVM